MRTQAPNRENNSFTDHSDLMRMAHEIALTHEEKWGGSGYPDSFAGRASVLKM